MIQTALYRCLFTKPCSGAKLLNNVRFMSSKIDFDKLVKQNKVVVFMKGTPKAPRCGFSNAVVKVLNLYDVEFDAHDVLSNEDMRQGIKEYTSWPTIPQVFINGEFIGGCDILVQMHYDKKLSKEFEKAGVKFSTTSEGEAAKEGKN